MANQYCILHPCVDCVVLYTPDRLRTARQWIAATSSSVQHSDSFRGSGILCRSMPVQYQSITHTPLLALH